jgi:polar amino acid transport system substrate-binding protein
MPFDSLIVSVQEGKIDVVIAAMQATAERDKQVDFSIPYRMTKDAFAAVAGTALTMQAPEDAAGESIGAQTGTVQEGWIQKNLVEAGLTPADQGVQLRALLTRLRSTWPNGRIELLLMDAERHWRWRRERSGVDSDHRTDCRRGQKHRHAGRGGGDDLKAEIDPESSRT